MRLGITGTQRGATFKQRLFFSKILYLGTVTEFHHGDCVGVDTQLHTIVKLSELPIQVIIHPPKIKSKRAFSTVTEGDVILVERDYLTRNHDIVDTTDCLMAFPGEQSEVLRSGTWSTIRYGVKKRKPVIICFPDGNYRITPSRSDKAHFTGPF